MIPRRMSLNVTHLPSLTSALYYMEWARFIKMGVITKSGCAHPKVGVVMQKNFPQVACIFTP